MAVMSSPAAFRRPGTRGRCGGAMVVTERVRRGLVLARGAAGAGARCREVFTVLAKVVGLLVLVVAEVVVVGLLVMALVLEVVELGTTVTEPLVQGAVLGLLVLEPVLVGALAATGAGAALTAAGAALPGAASAGCLLGALAGAWAAALPVLVTGGAGFAVVTVVE